MYWMLGKKCKVYRQAAPNLTAHQALGHPWPTICLSEWSHRSKILPGQSHCYPTRVHHGGVVVLETLRSHSPKSTECDHMQTRGAAAWPEASPPLTQKAPSCEVAK